MPKLRPVPEPGPRATPDLRTEVRAALAAMTWLTESDRAIAAIAQRLAHEIEEAADRSAELEALYAESRGQADIYKRLEKLEARCDVTKLVGWLGPQLQGVLKDLAGNPVARKAMQPDKPIGGRLAQIRRDAAGTPADGATAGVDDS